MAGLFGDLLSAQNLPQLSLAASLLSGKKGDDIGLKVSNFANSEIQQQNQERLNRANDLQQLQGVYNILKQQEFSRMLAAKNAGIPFTPNPAIDQVGQRILSLSGAGNLSGGNAPLSPSAAGVSGGPSAPSNFGASAGPVPTNPLPASVASQYSPVVKPQYQAQGPMPQPAPQPTQPTPQGSDPFGGPVFGIDPTEFALTDPSGQSYMKALLDQAKPITTRYGVYRINPQTGQVELAGGMVPSNALPIQMGPNGPSIAPLPGQVETQKALAQASATGAEAGKFPGRVENVTLASGATVPQLLSSVVGNPYSSPPFPQLPQTAIPPQVAKASGQPFEATQTPDGKVTVNTNPQDFWSDVPTIPQPSGVGQTQLSRDMTAARVKRTEALAEQYGQAADAAQFRLATNQQAKDMLNRADTGTGAAMLGDIKTFLVSRVGIPESDFKNDPAATTALNKDLMTAAVAKAKSMYGSRMTQNEVNNLLKRGAPNGDMLKGAISFLLDSDSATAAYDVQKAQDFGEFTSRNGDPFRFPGWYGKKRPLSASLSAVQLPANTPQNAANSGYGWSAVRVQ